MIKRAFCVFLFLVPAFVFADDKTTVEKSIEWYKERYPYIGDWGKVFTCETEFDIPANFQRLDSNKMTLYSHWVSFMPLWHYDKGVGSLRKGQVFNPDSISRAVRLPWRASKLTDAVLPLQIALEYLIWKGKVGEWAIAPKSGQEITFPLWLKSTVSYGADNELRFDTSGVRSSSDDELRQFFELIAYNTNYGSLARNADSIKMESLMPGDLLIGQNQEGVKGKVYVILNMLQKKKERLYLVATGCDFACDLYIPLRGADRRSPWLTIEEVQALVATWPVKGAYRLRLP